MNASQKFLAMLNCMVGEEELAEMQDDLDRAAKWDWWDLTDEEIDRMGDMADMTLMGW
jgi:hypothetical protein